MPSPHHSDGERVELIKALCRIAEPEWEEDATEHTEAGEQLWDRVADTLVRFGTVRLTKLEIAASLAAVRAVADSGMEALGQATGVPMPLTSAAEKFQKALDDLNGKEHHADR